MTHTFLQCFCSDKLLLLNNTSPLSTSQCARSNTAAMGWGVLAATLVVMAFLTVQLPAGVYVQNLCVNRDMCNHNYYK